MQNNLFFHQAHDGADCERHRLLLAMSAYNVIAVCEAVIDRVTYAERDKALSDIRSIVQMDVDDASDAMAKLFIGALFGMGD